MIKAAKKIFDVFKINSLFRIKPVRLFSFKYSDDIPREKNQKLYSSKSKIQSHETNEDPKLSSSKTTRKKTPIIPIRISSPIMPYNKSIKIPSEENLLTLISLFKYKAESPDFCVFFHDERRNLISSVGVICELTEIITRNEIRISSKKNEGRLRVENPEFVFQYEEFFSDIPKLKEHLVTQAEEISDDSEKSSIILDLDVINNLLEDINKVIFSFYEITSSRQSEIDNPIIKELNASVPNLQYIIGLNVDLKRHIESLQDVNLENFNSKEFLHKYNSLIFENIMEFVKLYRNFKKRFPYEEILGFLDSTDPIERTRDLVKTVYDLGDFIVKDLHMFDEYKKDSNIRNEKFMLRFIKKQVEQHAFGESAEIYIKRLNHLHEKGEISEPTKRSIQLEIDLAFNTTPNEIEMEDRKRFQILEDIFNFPWTERNEEVFDVKYTMEVLDSSLYGLDKVKERIYEYIAKLRRKHSQGGRSKGFVILITAPPGTGKTTIAQLIGKALKRNTGIINLSGETDTINLKGSRRTYIDSQPSIFFKEMVKLKVKNPVIILDEIDKIANKGDRISHSASSALLELLNPEENHNFIDQYLNIPLDFSEVIFICTSNYNINLLEPLLDRIEVIEINDCTLYEKTQITERFLFPRLLSDYGFTLINKEDLLEIQAESGSDLPDVIELPKEVLQKIIKDYSPDSTGVRSIKRSIEKVLRKLNIQLLDNRLLSDEQKRIRIDYDLVDSILGRDKSMDLNTLRLIKENKEGFLFSDMHGNIGRMILKAKPYSSHYNTSNRNLNLDSVFNNLSLLCKLSKPVKESFEISLKLARKKIRILIENDFPIDYINLYKKYLLYLTTPYVEKQGNSFGLAFLVTMISSIFEIYPSYDNVLVLGELSPYGEILRVVNLRAILSACEFYGIETLVLPEGKQINLGNRQEFEAFMNSSKRDFKAFFVSNEKQALEVIFKDYIKNSDLDVKKPPKGNALGEFI